jgi:membrane-bound serine protease (ClpP class)
MSEKAASDLAAYARTLAEARGRNVELAAAAVLESRAFTEHEALSATPPLIDLVASNVDELLRSLDGRRIRRVNGAEQTLQTSNPVIERVEMTRRQRLLAAIAHPQIAYLLMTLGMLGLVVEMWNPGAIVPGVVGGICLLLAFFAFQVLPVDITGIALIVLGMVLITIEVFVPSFGILGIGGIVALVAGAVMLTPEIPGVTVSYQFIVPVAIAAAALVFFLGRLGLKAQRARSVTGAEGLVGARARALTDIAPGRPGQVHVHGEIWSATSDTPIVAGAEVKVRAIEGLRLEVEPGESPLPRGDTT